MKAAPPLLGVATAPAKPPPATQLQPEPGALSAGWPRSAQVALALLLGLAAGLLAWHVYGMQTWGSRPTELDASATPILKFDLNRADRAQLLQLPGVGDSLARRILAYRTAHNGFRDVEELQNVSGIGATMLAKLRPFVYVEAVEDEEEPPATPAYVPPSTVPTRKAAPASADKKSATKKADGLRGPININEATAKELQQIPHVGPTLANNIVETRAKKPFQAVDDLTRVPGIKAKTLENLRPYVTVDASAKGETNQ
jgi:competence ComEA-like helix-hairpin-helix protein